MRTSGSARILTMQDWRIMNRFGVIMAGGGGTRFWPLSRKDLPKQFLNLTGTDLMVNETIDRMALSVPGKDIFVVTNATQADLMLTSTDGRVGKDHILAASRNTDPDNVPCFALRQLHVLHLQTENTLTDEQGTHDQSCGHILGQGAG